MGNALVGDGTKKEKELELIVERCYKKLVEEKDLNEEPEEITLAEFYHIVCETVEEINKKLGNTHFRVPKRSTISSAYQNHHQGRGKSLPMEDFQKILKEVVIDTGVTGTGAKDIFLYLFGVPAITTFIKQKAAPHAIPNEIFIPGITSATAFLLAKFNKI